MEINKFIRYYKELYPKEIQIDLVVNNDENVLVLKDFFSQEINDIYIYAWDRILSNIDVRIIDDEIFNFLLENEICIEKLSCMHLSYDKLIKIYNRYLYSEALLTVGRRIFFEERNNFDEILRFINLYKENWLMEYMLKCITICFITNGKNDIFVEKSKLLLEFALLNFDNCKILQLAKEKKLFLDVLLEKDEELLKEYYLMNSALVILALSINEYTPDYILEGITKIKNLKYGKIARSNAITKLYK